MHSTSPGRAFTLIELMIVLAIIATIAAIAIPNLLSSRKAGHEIQAIGYLKHWPTAQEFYKKDLSVYADDDAQLVARGLIPLPNNGYTYTIGSPSQAFYWFGGASPNQPGVTGDRYFYIDLSGVLRFNTSGPANSTSAPVGN